MHIDHDLFPPDGSIAHTPEAHGSISAGNTPAENDPRPASDQITFSDEAIRAFRESAIEPIKNGTFSLSRIESRISAVRAEIVQVWNSALPDDEKYRIISSRENEIALLQAGQFAFARAGFSMTA
jgi:hypothetical protein